MWCPCCFFFTDPSWSLYSFSSGPVASLSSLSALQPPTSWLPLMFLSCSSRSSRSPLPLPLLLSPLHFLELHQPVWLFSCFITSVSSSSQFACLMPCACGGGETAAASLGESHWAGGLMWCLGLSVSSIILYQFQDAAVVSLPSAAHPCGWVLRLLKGNKKTLYYFKVLWNVLSCHKMAIAYASPFFFHYLVLPLFSPPQDFYLIQAV